MIMDPMENRIKKLLDQPETAIADDGFSELVMGQLPRKRIGRSNSRRWTLAGAAAAGSALTNLVAPPVESIFGLYNISSYQTTIIAAALLVSVIAVPVIWLLQSDR